jgi:hypothetical protein
MYEITKIVKEGKTTKDQRQNYGRRKVRIRRWMTIRTLVVAMA